MSVANFLYQQKTVLFLSLPALDKLILLYQRSNKNKTRPDKARLSDGMSSPAKPKLGTAVLIELYLTTTNTISLLIDIKLYWLVGSKTTIKLQTFYGSQWLDRLNVSVGKAV